MLYCKTEKLQIKRFIIPYCYLKNIKIEHLGKNVSISSSFGVVSLKDNARYIEKTLNKNNFENIYVINNPIGTNWIKLKSIKSKFQNYY